MPINDKDNQDKSTKYIIKSGKELKRGDIVKDRGILLKVQQRSSKDGFWRGEPYMTFFDYHDAYGHSGMLCSSFDLKELFQVYNHRTDILRLYRRVNHDIDSYIVDMMQQRKDLNKTFDKIITKLNVEWRNEKKNKRTYR